MTEIWRDIKDYEGLYQVSNLGRVRSVDRYVRQKHNNFQLKKGKILKTQIACGYERIGLAKDGVYTFYLIHRLVAEAFIPNPNNYPTVDHINRIKTDNRVDNLRWLPYKLQAKNRDNESIRQASCKPVEQYTVDMEFVAEYTSAVEASLQTNISNKNIGACCQNKRKLAGGYIWKYKD